MHIEVSIIYNMICTDGNMVTPDNDVVTLKEVLIFFSGAESVPPTGFPRQPSLCFIKGPLPTASTCALELRVPTVHKSYLEFKEAMIMGMMGHGGFGRV